MFATMSFEKHIFLRILKELELFAFSPSAEGSLVLTRSLKSSGLTFLAQPHITKASKIKPISEVELLKALHMPASPNADFIRDLRSAGGCNFQKDSTEENAL